MLQSLFSFSSFFAQIENCKTGNPNEPDTLTCLPTNPANQTSLQVVVGIAFGVIAAVSILIIVIQAIKFSTAQGDPQKAADARKSIIYAIVGLVVALSAEVVVNVVIKRL